MHYPCSGCLLTFSTVSNLIQHIRKDCGLLVDATEFHCGFEKCKRHFSTLLALRYHLKLNLPEHVLETTNELSNNNSSTATCSKFVHNTDNAEENLTDDDAEVNSAEVSKGPDLEFHLATFMSALYCLPNVPRNTVQLVVSALSNLLDTSKDFIKIHFSKMLDAQGLNVPDEVQETLQSSLNEFTSSLSSLTSEYKRFKLFEKVGTLIPPTEIVIGHRWENKFLKTGPRLTSVPCTMQVVPMAATLKKILSIPNLLKEILEYEREIQMNLNDLVNISQGKVWQEILRVHGSKDYLMFPLVLFYDDFETGNPLGSHSGTHKLGGVYVSLPFLPTHYVSKLKNILLLALFHTNDRVMFGNKIVFHHIIETLNDLHKIGINISSKDYEGNIRFTVVAIAGDNLGLNSLLGFVESFSSNFCCRICKASKPELHKLVFEQKSLLRNNENYIHDLTVANPSTTGVKEKCIFVDTLEAFQLFENVSVDLLHDFLEGCCRYVIPFILNYFVMDAKLISFEIVQGIVTDFDYGPDSSSKPANCIIREGNVIKVKTSGSEMLTFVRYFGVMFGKYVPEGSNVWELYLYLRKILEKLLNHRTDKGSAKQLEFLVAGFNELYINVTKSNLTPKFHFLTHYPNMLLKFGPLTQIWTMRFEAKHRMSKMASKVSCNRTNLCKTLAIKNQLVLNDVFLNNKSCTKELESSKRVQCNNNEIEIVVNTFKLDSHSTQLFWVKWFRLNSHLLRVSSVVLIDVNMTNYLPLFGEIGNIYINEKEEVFLKLLLLHTIDFDGHVYAYHCRKTNDSALLRISNLMTMEPCTSTIDAHDKLFVTLRSQID